MKMTALIFQRALVLQYYTTVLGVCSTTAEDTSRFDFSCTGTHGMKMVKYYCETTCIAYTVYCIVAARQWRQQAEYPLHLETNTFVMKAHNTQIFSIWQLFIYLIIIIFNQGKTSGK